MNCEDLLAYCIYKKKSRGRMLGYKVFCCVLVFDLWDGYDSPGVYLGQVAIDKEVYTKNT